MRRAALLAAVVGALPGCFYFEAINQRPSIQIVNDAPAQNQRGQTAQLHAIADDPDGDPIKFTWFAYACTDASERATCDAAPFDSSSTDTFSFVIVGNRLEAAAINESVLVTLAAKDAYNAVAEPAAELIIPITNLPPAIELAKSSRYNFVVGTPVDIVGEVRDGDDAPTLLALTWDRDPPAGGMREDAELVDGTPATIFDPADPERLQYAKVFTPHTTGEWNVLVHVEDPLHNAVDGMITVNVAEDAAPCLAQLAPAVPPAGAALPLSAPTLFRVPVVTDDLDPYPLIPGDPIFRAARFEWSVKGPGQATHLKVPGASANTFALDPASYAPGDLVEVRVQIYDRKNTPIPCIDGEASCSTISQDSCIQRQTWRVEVR